MPPSSTMQPNSAASPAPASPAMVRAVSLAIDRGRALAPESSSRFGQITLTAAPSGKHLEIRVPFAAAEQLFYRVDVTAGGGAGGGARCMCIGSDPRRLRLPSMAVDERSIYAILQFGAIVPPMSLWQGIVRFTPGCRHIIHTDDLRVETHPLVDEWPAPEAADPTLAESGQAYRVTNRLDEIMHEACPSGDPLILFSGGVDSGLIAARAAAMGWRDALLVHYSMGEDDPETEQAQAVAKHLGLKIEIVRDRESDDLAVLERAASIWPQPFCDSSTLPTYALSRGVIDGLRTRSIGGGSGSGSGGGGSVSRVIFDGTGADGCFGMFNKAAAWHSVARMPTAARRLGASAYAAGRMWRRTGALELRLRLLRRSMQMPLLPAAIAQNPLLDIAYRAPSEAQHAVFNALRHWLEHALPCADEPARLAGLDVALVCANIFAQKNKPIFDASAHRIVYPFLDQRMVGLALRRAVRWPNSEESKRPLKAALAEQVPAELVYRRKSGFVAPLRVKFANPKFLAAFDRLLDPAAPLSNVVDRAWLQRVRRDLHHGRSLPPQTHSFVWAAVFTNLWLTQAAVVRGA